VAGVDREDRERRWWEQRFGLAGVGGEEREEGPREMRRRRQTPSEKKILFLFLVQKLLKGSPQSQP